MTVIRMPGFKGTIMYSPSCCSKFVWVSFFCWTQNKIFWRMLANRQLT